MDEVTKVLYGKIMSKYDERADPLSANPLGVVNRWAEELELKLQSIPVIHIAGTKGKGSTAAFCESILRQCGYRTGLYTSPHLFDVRERIRIGGQLVSEEAFVSSFWHVWNTMEIKLASGVRYPPLIGPPLPRPGFFRFLTLLSFHIFAVSAVDIIVLEVGIGGRYDSTNIVKAPWVTGVTTLDLDHTKILGDTLEKIAFEKCGIFKAGVPAFATTPASDSIMEVFRKCAADERASELTMARPLSLWPTSTGSPPSLGLQGDFQAVNASLALELCNVALQQLGKSTGRFPTGVVGEEGVLHPSVMTALAAARWPGRCQVLSTKSGQAKIYVDGAHTPMSINAAAKWFRNSVAAYPPSESKVLVFYCGGERNAALFLQELVGLGFSTAIFVAPSFEKPSRDAVPSTAELLAEVGVHVEAMADDDTELRWQKILARTWQALHSRQGALVPECDVLVKSNVKDAVDWIDEEKKGSHVFVTGSLYIVGDILKELEFKIE